MADEGGDGMMRTVIFVGAFVAIFALLVSGVSGIFGTEDDLSGGLKDKSFSARELTGMTWWTSDDTPGWLSNATVLMAGTYWNAPPPGDVALGNLVNDHVWIDTDAAPYDWSGPNVDYQNEHAIRVYLMDDGSVILFRQGGGWDRWWQTLSPLDIMASTQKRDDGSSIATMSVNVGVGVRMTFIFPAGYDPLVCLQNNGPYQFGIGQMPMDKVSTSKDVWSVIAQLLTFDLQATGVWWIDYIFSLIVWSAIIYVSFWMITRVLDLIPFT